jgi:hypothetical protein
MHLDDFRRKISFGWMINERDELRRQMYEQNATELIVKKVKVG